MSENYKFVQNKACEYFPCHKTSDPENFNCLFCFCPLYMLKQEQSIANIKETGDERSVTKGVITSRKNNAGRPRGQSLLQS